MKSLKCVLDHSSRWSLCMYQPTLLANWLFNSSFQIKLQSCCVQVQWIQTLCWCLWMPSTSKETGRSSLTKRTPERCVSKSPWWVLNGPLFTLASKTHKKAVSCSLCFMWLWVAWQGLPTNLQGFLVFSSCIVPHRYLLAPQFLAWTLLLWFVMLLLESAYGTNLQHCSLFTLFGSLAFLNFWDKVQKSTYSI